MADASKTRRMFAVYEREKELRAEANADVHRAPKSKEKKNWKPYKPSKTAEALRGVFERKDEPWW